MSKIRKQLIALLTCVLIVGAPAALLLFPVAQGMLPVPTNGVFSFPPWETATPDGVSSPPDIHSLQAAQRLLPWRIFLQDTILRGDSLLWNPLEGGGVPYLALWRTRCFSPFSIPYYVLPLSQALPLSAFLKLFVAGLAAYIAARFFGLRRPTSAAVAIGAELSAPVLLWLEWPLADCSPWIPFLLIAADRVRRGRPAAWTVLAIVYGLIALGGEPEVLVALTLNLLIFICLSSVLSREYETPPLLQGVGIAAALLLGLSIAGIQIVPFIEFARLASFEPQAMEESPGFIGLATCFLPHFFGSPPTALAGGQSRFVFAAISMLFSGVSTLMLVVLWVSLKNFLPKDQRIPLDCLLGSALITQLLAVTLGPMFPDTSFVVAFRPYHLTTAWTFVTLLVAAKAGESWLSLDADQCKETIGRLLIGWGLLLGIAASLVVAGFGDFRPAAPSLLNQLIIVALIVFGTVGLLALTLFKPSVKILGGGYTVLITAEFLCAFWPGLVFSPASSIFPETPFIASVKEAKTRISGRDALKTWPLAGNLVPQLYGSSGADLRRHQMFLSRLPENPLLLRQAGSPLLLLGKEDVQRAFAAVRPLLRIERVFPSGALLFRDLQTQSRVRLAYQARPTDQFDPAQLAPDQPPIIETQQTYAAPSAPVGVVTLVAPESNSTVRAHVSQNQQGILILSDSWYPGWEARIDGEPAEVFPVDGTFRGVIVDAGDHDIEFIYRPKSLRFGAMISAVAIAIVLTTLFINIRSLRSSQIQ